MTTPTTQAAPLSAEDIAGLIRRISPHPATPDHGSIMITAAALRQVVTALEQQAAQIASLRETQIRYDALVNDIPDYWREAIGARYNPVSLGKYAGSHPETVRRVLADVEGTEAADVIAALAFKAEMAWQNASHVGGMARVASRRADAAEAERDALMARVRELEAVGQRVVDAYPAAAGLLEGEEGYGSIRQLWFAIAARTVGLDALRATPNSRVVLRIDKEGFATCAADVPVEVLIVCERYPQDRVYEVGAERVDTSDGAVDRIIGDSRVGSLGDMQPPKPSLTLVCASAASQGDLTAADRAILRYEAERGEKAVADALDEGDAIVREVLAARAAGLEGDNG